MLGCQLLFDNKYCMVKKFNETELSNFQARYGTDIPDNDYPTSDFVENLLKRRTIRRYSDKEINPKLLEKLIAAAQSAPTSSMLQPWSVITLSREKRKILCSEKNAAWLGIKAKKRSLSDPHNLNTLMSCSVYLVWLADNSILNSVFNDLSLKDRYGTDIVNKQRQADFASKNMHYELRTIIDAVVAAQTLVLAAESVGIGVQYMGSIRNMDLKEDLNLPDHVMPLFGIALGYPSDDAGVEPNTKKNIHTKPRLPQSLIFHTDSHKSLDSTLLHNYNNLMKDFYSYYELPNDWFYRAIDRTYPLENNFRDLVNKYGFYFK